MLSMTSLSGISYQITSQLQKGLEAVVELIELPWETMTLLSSQRRKITPVGKNA